MIGEGTRRVNVSAMSADPEFRALPAAKQADLLQKADARNKALMAGAPMGPPESMASPLTPDQQTDKAHPWYAKFRQPATAAVERFLSSGVSSSPENAAWQKDLAGSITRNFIVPQTPTDAAVTAAMMASGVGEAEMGGKLGLKALTSGPMKRVALTSLAGAAGDVAGGGNGLHGAFQGAVGQMVGDSLGAAVGIGGRAISKNKILGDTLENAGSEITQNLPVVGDIRTPTDFERTFARGEGVKKAGAALSDVRDEIAQKYGQVPIKVRGTDMHGVPRTLTGTFDQIEKRIDLLNNIGNNPISGQARGSLSGKAARAEARSLRSQVVNAIGKLEPKLGATYKESLRQFGAVKDLTQIFQNNPDLFQGPGGTLNQQKLADLIGRKHAEELVHSLGPDGYDRLIAALRHGAKGPAFDVAAEKARVGLSIHRMHPPRTYRPAGPNIPWYAKQVRGPYPMNTSPFGLTVGRPVGEFGADVLMPEDLR